MTRRPNPITPSLLSESSPGLSPSAPPALAVRWLALLAVFKLAVHVPVLGRYGFFIDELYYLACADHLAFGYVDHPPGIALVAALSGWWAGESLVLFRLPAALAGAASVFAAGWLARELGGGRRAQIVSAVALLVGPLYLYLHTVLSMNSFDVPLSIAALALVARRLRSADAGVSESDWRAWVLLGLVLGVGLQFKLTPLFYGAGLALGIGLHRRRLLATAGPWIAGATAWLVFAPHLIWQAIHDWPTLEFMRNASQTKNRELSPVDFALGHALDIHPLVWLLALGGVIALFAGPRWRRPLVWTYLFPAAFFLVGGGKTYYLGSMAPVAVAAGAVALEGWLGRAEKDTASGAFRWRPSRRWVLGALVGLLLASGAVMAPATLPILSPDDLVEFYAAQGGAPESGERKEVGPLPQHFADMFGHEELVAAVASVRDSLPSAERDRVAIFAESYAQAGAIDHLGDRFGLPPAMAGHNSYWLWGPTPNAADATVWLIIGGSREGLETLFDSVEEGARVSHPLAMPWRNDKPIWIARGAAGPVDAIWPELRHYD